MDYHVIIEFCKKTEFWKDWNFWLALSTTIIALIALWQTRQNTKLSNLRQKQDTGLSLLPLRKTVLEMFKKQQYDEIYWDATMLFSDTIVEAISHTQVLHGKYKDIVNKIDYLKDLIKERNLEDFEEIEQLEILADDQPEIKQKLYKLCDKYCYTVTMPGTNKPVTLFYRDLDVQLADAWNNYAACNLKTFIKIKKEIKDSIELHETSKSKKFQEGMHSVLVRIKKAFGFLKQYLGECIVKTSFIKVLSWMIPIVLAILLLLYWAGFRITYNASIITSWDAVSGCAAWASVVASLIAIGFAIQVPKTIAERQNKIALFEKRYSVYYALSQCLQFADGLELFLIEDNDPYTVFAICFDIPLQLEKKELQYQVLTKAQEVITALKQSEFLFSQEISNNISELCKYLAVFLGKKNAKDDEILKLKDDYLQQAQKVHHICVPLMQEKLKLE